MSSPVLVRCEKIDASFVVVGDDCITLGSEDALGEVEHVMSSHYTVKVRAILGADREDAKET